MVKIIDTTFRDAHQSLIATRFRTEDMLPIAEKMDAIGFYSMEVWGGATFDVAIRYLREDPWERLRQLGERITHTKFQMLLRGQNVVGYKHYPDDVVERFVELAHKNGIDIFRVFDALNDVRNMQVAIKKAKEVGAEVQGSISYTTGKVFTLDYYMRMVDSLISLDVDTITIKDMAGLLTPMMGYELVTAIKERYGIPVNVHSHSTSGMVVATYCKVVEAGVDYIDTAISPLAFGTAQPGIQSVYETLPEEQRPKVDMEKIYEIEDYLKPLLEGKYKKYLNPKVLMVNTQVLKHHIPGGMFSNLLSQLKEMGVEDKLDEVLKEIPNVRADMGYPPLVTPSSQIVGTQAVMNVLFGRYKKITKQTRDYVRGLYGRPPAEISEEIKKLILNGEEPIQGRPGDHIPPMLEKCEKYVKEKGYYTQDEDVLSYCLFPEQAEEFFKLRAQGKLEPVDTAPKLKGRVYRIHIDGEEYDVGVEEVR
ncbi:MAG: pyruvate carboxylase subunit B [Euryarchaeota archaeon]|nr:pyruvate carboxylase subunit B [Euryarchaeota archaeon]